MNERRRYVQLFVGIALLSVAAWGGHHIQDPDYVHRLEDSEDTTFESGRDGYFQYENLSSRGRTVVSRTIEQGEFTVDSADERAPEFEYTTDNTVVGEGLYVIQRNSEVYVVSTHKRTVGLTGVVVFWPIVGVLGLAGIVLLARTLL